MSYHEYQRYNSVASSNAGTLHLDSSVVIRQESPLNNAGKGILYIKETLIFLCIMYFPNVHMHRNNFNK